MKKYVHLFSLLCLLSAGNVWGMETTVAVLQMDCFFEILDYINDGRPKTMEFVRLACKDWEEAVLEYSSQNTRKPVTRSIPVAFFELEDMEIFRAKLNKLKQVLSKGLHNRKAYFDCNHTAITNEQLSVIGELFKENLIKLNLSSCYDVGDAGFGRLVLCEGLQNLSLAFCDRITDKALISISELSNLRELCLEGCYKITDEGLRLIAKLAKLEFLDLTSCSKIKDNGIQCLVACKNLRMLILEGCFSLKREYIKKLFQNSPNMKIKL
jgi:hypothetical protein